MAIIQIFKCIWKLCVPERAKVFVWQVAHGRILTRDLCNRWWGGIGHYPFCPSLTETIFHVLRDCPVATAIWNSLVSPDNLVNFYSLDLNDWIKNNIQKELGINNENTWSHVWAFTIWKLWRWRCATIHDADFRKPNAPVLVIQNLVDDYNQSKEVLGYATNGKTEHDIGVTWRKPAQGWMKLNTDGACKGETHMSGCGGILRNDDGAWVIGFYRFLGSCSVLRSEDGG